MKKSFLGYMLLFTICAIVSHFYVLNKAPASIMSTVLERAQKTGSGGYPKVSNEIGHVVETTETSRRVVRPSPDLIYSVCVFDLSNGPVVLEMTPGSVYHSLSLFDANTDNFYVINDRELNGNRARIILSKQGAGGLTEVNAPMGTEAFYTESETNTGIALIRRLAATPEMLAEAKQVRQTDVCEPWVN